jgi:hypothetical protein
MFKNKHLIIINTSFKIYPLQLKGKTRVNEKHQKTTWRPKETK